MTPLRNSRPSVPAASRPRLTKGDQIPEAIEVLTDAAPATPAPSELSPEAIQAFRPGENVIAGPITDHAIRSGAIKFKQLDAGNVFEFYRCSVRSLTIDVKGTGNRIILEDGVSILRASITITADNCTVRIGANARFKGGVVMQGDGCSMTVGARTVMNSNVCSFVFNEGPSSIAIGEDCLLSACYFRTSDGHGIFDMNTGERVNPAGDIVIGERVWIGAGATISKGANVGADSVVAAGAFVSKASPPNCIIGGVPAKVIRTGIIWRKDKTLAAIDE